MFYLETEFQRLKEELFSSLKEKMLESIKEKVNAGEYTLRQGADLEELLENRGIDSDAWTSSSYC